MGIVGTGFSMSLDGFIAGPDGNIGRLFDWYSSGDTDVVFPSGTLTVKVAPASAEILQDLIHTVGAIVSGRKQFDIAHGWDGRHPMDVPVFVVTHRVSHEWVYDGSPFTFVTDGVESAVAQATAVAGGKNVAVDGANVAQQCIRAGLVDEIFVNLVPVLLGTGIRFFDNLGPEQVELESTLVVAVPGVTHLRFRVVK